MATSREVTTSVGRLAYVGGGETIRGIVEPFTPVETSCPKQVDESGQNRRHTRGRLAQLVEQLVYTEKVGGSSPSPPTK